MTAKDFKAIADIIKKETYWDSYGFPYVQSKVLSEELADYFKTTNAKFDRERFLKACGVEY